MIQDLKPYPAYQASGLPWLGEIPQEWEVRRNGRLFAQRNETRRAELPILEVSLRTGVRVRSFGEGERKQTMADPEKYKRAAKGDLAYNMMRMWQGALGVSPVDGLVSPAYVVARPFDDVEARYYAYLFRTDAYLNEVDKFSRGIVKDRNRLYWEDFKRIPSPYPPKEEQAAIVRFLDHVDRCILRAIRAKRKMIALLNEQKQVIIHQAVTRGLNPNARLKPSGVEWLGDVPEHWEVRKIKHLAGVGYKTFVDGDWIESPYITSEGIRLIQTGNIGLGEYREKGFRYISLATFDAFGCTEFVPGDVLICRLGDPVGRACLAPTLNVRMITSVDVCILKPSVDVSARFIVYAMSSPGYLGWVNSLVRGSTRDRVSRSMLGDFLVPLPPLPEQEAIGQFISDAIHGVQSVVDAANLEITLLREFRFRLIADVVTGKLDVREAVAQLPTEELTTESADDTEAILEDEGIPEDADTEEMEA